MKAFKTILLLISNLLTVPLACLTAFGTVWFVLPELSANTELGLFVTNQIGLNTSTLFWITIVAASVYLVLLILQKIFDKSVSSKLKNFFIHLNTWLMTLVVIGLSIYTFIVANPLVAEEVIITMPRKIGIGVILGVLILYHIFSTKILTIINRKIQSYENARESNIVGRSSVIFVNMLKLLEVFFPEMIILGLLCFCVSWNVASYFIVVLVACLIPVIGNIMCDFNIRTEIAIKKEIEKDLLAQKVAKNLKEGV